MSAPFHRPIARLLWAWGPSAALMGAIFILSDTPTPPFANRVPDYWAHMAVYGLLSAAILHGLAGGRWRDVTWPRFLLAVLLSAAYGLTDEYHQAFVPGRTPSAGDLAADLVGGALGAGGAWVWSIVLAGRRGRNHTSHGS